MNAEIFATYLELVLIPMLRAGMVLIIDNARFHKSQKINKLMEAAKCRLIYLPPYSPDYNPIEHRWSGIKTRIKSIAKDVEDFYEATVQGLAEVCTA